MSPVSCLASDSGPNPNRARVLLVLVAGIGDFVMATPAIRSISKCSPGARLTLLTTPQAVPLAEHCPYLDQVVRFDLRTFRPDGHGVGWHGRRSFGQLTADLRKSHFDLAVNLYRIATIGGAIRMWLLLRRIHAPRTAGRWSGGRGFFFDLRSPDQSHETDAMLSLASTLGCPSDNDLPELWVPETARQSARAKVRDLGLGVSTPYAVFNIGSNREAARLPIPKAVEIGRGIRRVSNLRVLLTGDPQEAPTTAAVAAQLGEGAMSLAGQTDLLELAALMEAARLVVTTDSGPMHIASAMKTPLVALFGPADPACFGPRGHPERVVLLQGRTNPRDPRRWYADLTEFDVAEAALKLLGDIQEG
jgi:ADP-heptose:LPS heptosyltransferase